MQNNNSANINNESFLTDSENNRSFLTPYDYAAIYARKSIKTESHSIASQIARGKEVLNEHSLVLFNTYFDSESASRYTYDKREGFKELLRDLENNKFKNIIVLKRDRLSRRFDELLEIKKKFRDYDVNVIYSAPGEFQPDKDDCYSDFIENIIMGISELEPKILKDRTSNGIRIKRERGEYSRSGNIPFGFASKDDEFTIKDFKVEKVANYELFPKKDEVPIVEKIFYGYVNRDFETMNDFVDYVSTINDSNKNLSKNQITYMLTNPIYAGIQRPTEDLELFIKDSTTNKFKINEEKIKLLDNVKAFIDRELWAKAALKYLNNKRHYSNKIKNYIFKDLLECSNCGKNVTISGNYYACSTRKCTRIKKDILINTLLRKIVEDILTEENIRSIISEYKEHIKMDITFNKANLAKLQKEKESNLLDFISDISNTSIFKRLKNLIDKEKDIIEEISRLEDKLHNLDEVLIETSKIRNIGSSQSILNFLKDELQVDKVQENLHSFVEKVSVCGSTNQCNIREIKYGR